MLGLSIAVLIVGLVWVNVPKMLSQTTAIKAIAQQELLQQSLGKALQTFLRVNGYLPCPDVNGDGWEDRRTNQGQRVCKDREGGLPYAQLGFSATDAWGNPWYYRVHQRAEQGKYITQVCEPASVFANQGAEDLTDFWFCPDSKSFYCVKQSSANNCDSVCSSACVNTIAAHPPAYQNRPPYYHLSSRPVGTLPVAYDIEIADPAGELMIQGAIAVVISWGVNGAKTYTQSCTVPNLTEAERENCDGDLRFVSEQTSQNKDFVYWFDMHQAKFSLIQSRRFQ